MLSAGDKTDTNIEILDKGIEEIGSAVDFIILSAEQHLQERLANGEVESVLSFRWHPIVLQKLLT